MSKGQKRRRGVADTYTKTASVSLSVPQYKAVKRRAKRDGKTISTVIREAVGMWLDQSDPEALAALNEPETDDAAD